MKDSRGMDRRIFRTRTMIFQSFLVILQKKPYHEISIVDIAEQADINRSTFYAHFIDKEDLLQKMIADKLDLLAERIRVGVEPSYSTPSFNDPDLIFLALFEHVFEHDYFYQVMLPNDAAGDFRIKFNGLIREAFFSRLSKLGIEQKLQVPLDILLDYISCSTIGIMEKWLMDSKIYSPHHMALQLTRLGFLGIYKSIGL